MTTYSGNQYQKFIELKGETNKIGICGQQGVVKDDFQGEVFETTNLGLKYLKMNSDFIFLTTGEKFGTS